MLPIVLTVDIMQRQVGLLGPPKETGGEGMLLYTTTTPLWRPSEIPTYRNSIPIIINRSKGTPISAHGIILPRH